MTFNTRQEEILKTLRHAGEVEVEHLANIWGVTTQTIRRDLSEICDAGMAVRTHGGAKQMIATHAISYEDRRLKHAIAKSGVADAVANIVPNGASLSINIGTTTEMVAEALRLHSGLTVVSNNINITHTLMGSRLKSLNLVGGEVRLSDGAIIGDDAIRGFANFKVDFAIIGASSLDSDGSVLDFDHREVAVSRAILENARQKILVADVSKFDVSAPYKICAAHDLDYIVLDAPAPPDFAASLNSHTTKLIITGEQNVHAN